MDGLKELTKEEAILAAKFYLKALFEVTKNPDVFMPNMWYWLTDQWDLRLIHDEIVLSSDVVYEIGKPDRRVVELEHRFDAYLYPVLDGEDVESSAVHIMAGKYDDILKMENEIWK
jgi:hypothetical protein